MKKAAGVIFLVAGLVFIFSSNLRAESEMATDEAVQNSTADLENTSLDAVSAEDENYSYGIVQEIVQKTDGTAAVTIAEYDYEGDQNIDTNYLVNADTKFDNIGSIGELVKDDSVEIYFKTSGDDKIVTRLIKEIIENDETATDEEMPLAEPLPLPLVEPTPEK